MAPKLRCLLLLTLLGWESAARTGISQRQAKTAIRVNATESKAAVLPCGGPGTGNGSSSAHLALSWLWKGSWDWKLLSLNVTLGEPPPNTGTGIGVRGSLVLPSVSTSDAGVYTCQWDGADMGAVLLNVPGSRKLYVSGNPGGQVTLPCAGENANKTAIWARSRNNRTHQPVHDGLRHQLNGSTLLIKGLGPDDTGWYHCQAGNWSVHLSLGGELSVSVPVGNKARLPCNGSMPDTWVHGSLSWARLRLDGSRKLLVALAARRSGSYAFQLVLGTGVALVLPAVTLGQAGTYFCVSANASHAVELVVTPHAGRWQPWIVGAAALGYVVLGLASLYGYCQIRRALQTRRRRKHLIDPTKRFFKVTANGAHTPYVSTLLPMALAGVGQTDAVPYENVGLGTRRQGRPFSAERPIRVLEPEDEEEYEHPDSEAESALEDGDGYENTNGDVKVCMGDKRFSDDTCYENSLEESRVGGGTWVSGAPCYSNACQGPGAEDLASEDGECYENTEEDGDPLSPGATRLVTDLRLLLLGTCEELGRDRQDGQSEDSAGSQAYEEMAGALYAAPVRRLRDCTQEEDADSYENMEVGPGGLLPTREGSVELRGDAAGLKARVPAGAELSRRPGPRSGERS